MGNCTSLPLPKGAKGNLQNLLNQAISPEATEDQLAKLISSKVDVNTKMEHEGIGSCYPIHIATKVGNLKAVEMLIKAGADVHLPDSNGKTALHWAAVGTDEQILEELVKAGSDMNAKANDSTTPLQEAIAAKDDGMVEKLIELGVDVNFSDDNCDPPLLTAVKEDNALACYQLIQAKVTPDASVISAVHAWASENNHEFVLELLEKRFPDGEADAVPRQEGDGAEQLETAREVTEDGAGNDEVSPPEEGTAEGETAEGEATEGDAAEEAKEETAEEAAEEQPPTEDAAEEAEPTGAAAPEEEGAEGEPIVSSLAEALEAEEDPSAVPEDAAEEAKTADSGVGEEEPPVG